MQFYRADLLSGRTALVTGSSRGLGRAIATALAGYGATVAFHGRQAPAGVGIGLGADLTVPGVRYIVNIGSIAGFAGPDGGGGYGEAKAELHALTRDLARMMAPRTLVNRVAPGPVEAGGGLRPRGISGVRGG